MSASGIQIERPRKRFRSVPPLIATLAGVALFSSGYEVEFENSTVTLERLVAIPLLTLAAIIAFLSRRAFGSGVAGRLLVAWLMVGLLASLLSPVGWFSLKMWVLLAIAVSYFFSARLAYIDPFSAIRGPGFAIAALVLGPLASLVFVVEAQGINVPLIGEAWIHESGGGSRLTGPFLEPNLYCCFASVFALLAYCRNYSAAWVKAITLVGLNLGIVLSFSRVPLIAYLLSCGICYLLLRPRRYSPKYLLRLMLGCLLALFALGAIAYIFWVEYKDIELVGRTGSIITRFYMWELAVLDVMAKPLLGSGVFSFSEMHPMSIYAVGSDDSRAAWVSNSLLLTLHDSGVVGLSLFVAAMYFSLKGTIKKIRRVAIEGSSSSELKLGAALVAGVICLIIAGQSVPSYTTGMFWLILASAELGASKIAKAALGPSNA